MHCSRDCSRYLMIVIPCRLTHVSVIDTTNVPETPVLRDKRRSTLFRGENHV